MPTVKLTQGRVGDRFAQSAGDEVEVSSDEAKRLIEAGQAVPVRGQGGQVEKAVSRAAGERK